MIVYIPTNVSRSLRPLVVSLFPGQQRLLDQLKTKREELANELTDVVNEFGPKLYEDFDEVSHNTPQILLP
jgi:glycerol-3-phosphate O-acyltransferase/dihydroxyacetone phosphate acyltransferase